MHSNKIMYFCNARGEKSSVQECVSCFYPYNEIANFKGGVETMRRSFCLYILKVQPLLYPTRYIRQRGVFVSQFILLMVFGDTSYTMSATSLYAFLVSVSQTHY